MKVRIFRQRVSQAHESEVEINDWLAANAGRIKVFSIAQSTYMTDNNENAQPGHLITLWYDPL